VISELNPERHRFGRIGRIPTPTPFAVGDINCYVLFPPAGSDSLTLIDTGVKSPDAYDAICRGLKDFGLRLGQIDRILITHAHLDHFGQARRLREASGAAVYASGPEAERMKGPFRGSADRDETAVRYFRSWGIPDEIIFRETEVGRMARDLQDPLEVDGILAEGDRVDVEDLTLTVLETPGHCDGHLVFFEAELGALFSGDHLLTDISPVPLLVLPAVGERPKSLVRFMGSLAKVERLDCDMTFPSHGGVIYDHRKLIDGYRLHHERRKLQFERELRKCPHTPFELAQKLFAKYYRDQIFLVMSEVIGHLDLLVEEGNVVVETDGGVERARIAT
jgi:glyoxylase-like metal-dependent hydrolase (beta-lactamase superfamily II)